MPEDLAPPGVERGRRRANGVELHYARAGAGEGTPLVLLHGFPQSWLIWRKTIPDLAREHPVLAVDLRGYGDSGKPPPEAGYDQRTLAADVRALTRELGLDRPFIIVGHDRGARVGRRYALDHPEDLLGAALLDILPAEYVYDRMSAAEVAGRLWHWVFNVVPDLPEKLIAGNEEAYLERLFGRSPDLLRELRADGAFDEYLKTFREPGGAPAALSDYRATRCVDVPRYREERAAGKKVAVPLLLLWGERGNLAGREVGEIWGEVASGVRRAHEIPGCGHYLPEEAPEAVAGEVLRFAAGVSREVKG